MIIDKLVKTGVNSKTIPYYINLGYVIPTWKNPINNRATVKKGTKIYVSSLDLLSTSTTKIEVVCDICGAIFETKRVNVKHSKNCCKNCIKHAARDTMLEKYGVSNIMYLEDYKDKIKETCIERYGVDNPLKSEDVKKKFKKTCIEKYGVSNPNQNKEIIKKREKTCLNKYGNKIALLNEEIKNKSRKTIKEKYGVEFISQSEECKKKVKETTQKKYGVDSVLQLESVREKINPKYSYAQLYICKLYNGELNYPFKKYNFDILVNKNIDIEIDFGGHELSVKRGEITQDEFDKKQMIRDIISRRNGYKVVRLISRKDKMPCDDILLKILEDIKKYFNLYPNHSWITFDIDKSLLFCAECKNGIDYYYGVLKKYKNYKKVV